MPSNQCTVQLTPLMSDWLAYRPKCRRVEPGCTPRHVRRVFVALVSEHCFGSPAPFARTLRSVAELSASPTSQRSYLHSPLAPATRLILLSSRILGRSLDMPCVIDADASAAGEFYGHLSAIMSGLVADLRESQVDLVAGLLAQVILKWVAHRQQPGSAGDGAKIWDSFLQNAVTLMANKKGYRASVLLAHSLRQAVATGGAEVPAQARVLTSL